MDLEALLATITENPVVSGAVVGALGAVLGFFRPIMGALQAALVRRINQAWADDSGEGDLDERVRRTAEHVRRSTRVPLPQTYVEEHVRRAVSEAPPDIAQPPL